MGLSRSTDGFDVGELPSSIEIGVGRSIETKVGEPAFSRIAPVDHNFPIWPILTSGRGRDLTRIIHISVDRFPDYADT
jgi:hypothetical protein